MNSEDITPSNVPLLSSLINSLKGKITKSKGFNNIYVNIHKIYYHIAIKHLKFARE